MPTLELSMIVKNGQATLARCLESVCGIVDKIVVGDTGSNDNTAAIAGHYGARLIRIPWENDFAKARNAVLQQGNCDWVLFLDADEMLDPCARATIPVLLAKSRVWGYQLPIWNYVRTLTYRMGYETARPNPGRLGASAAYPAYVRGRNVRLFRRDPRICFEKRVHEGVADRIERMGLKTEDADLVIHHFGLAEADDTTLDRKHGFYQMLCREKARERPNDALAHFEVGLGELEHFHDPETALRSFERVIELKPTSAIAWTFAGICQVRLGRFQDALAKLEHAEHLGARGAVFLEAQGDAFFQLRNFSAATRCYQNAVTNGSHSAVLESKLGVCEIHLGSRNEGLRRIEHAIEREPGFPELYDILMAAALLLGDLKLTAETAERRLTIGQPTQEDFLQTASLWAQQCAWQKVNEVIHAGSARFPHSEKLQMAMAACSSMENSLVTNSSTGTPKG